MAEYKILKCLRSKWNLSVNPTKTALHSNKVVKMIVNICNKLIAHELLVSARYLSKGASTFLGRSFFSVFPPSVPL